MSRHHQVRHSNLKDFMKIPRTRSVDSRQRIPKKTIAKIVQEIVRACKPRLVILFGSYGRGNPTEDSDLDLFVVADLPGSSTERIRFVQRAITATGFGMDIVVRTPEQYGKAMAGRDWFVQEIVEQGKVMYAR
jgi:predicted nucleotidyltransferase